MWNQAGNPAKGAPYMVAQVLAPTGVRYDLVEGQWLCTDAAEATYYCLHSWYTAASGFTGIADGSGYAGFQVLNGKPWAILSLWSTEHGKPTIEYAPAGSVAEPFGGEGAGLHVLTPYPWRTGQWYVMRVQARTVGARTCYELWVHPEGGAWQKLAAISFPRPGLGFLWDCFFLEDWVGNDCLRSCRLRGYYARKGRWSWHSLDRFVISNHRGAARNVLEDCGFGQSGKDAVWISSGGGYSLSLPAMPCEIRIAQPRKPAFTDWLD